MRVRIRLIDGASLPIYQTTAAAGFDLAANEDVVVAPGAVALVRTGVVIEVPPGFVLGVFARSSTPLKKGLMIANGVGVVDPDYAGPEDEIKIEVYNFTPRAVEVQRGDRLAQGLLLPCARADWELVDQLRERSRGGFGATG